MNGSNQRKRLCIIVCGAGPAPDVGKLLTLAHAKGWQVDLVATLAALKFLDIGALQRHAGSAVRSDYGQRAHGSRSSDFQALIMAPATFNSINKLAAGINDTYALNVAAEAIGRGVRSVILPFVNSALAARSPFRNSVQSLRAEGVDVLIGKGKWEPHPPGAGGEMISSFPWTEALEAVERWPDSAEEGSTRPESPV